MSPDDAAIRAGALEFIRAARDKYADCIPWAVLLRGFDFRGDRVPLVSQQGIFKPRLCNLPLTIRTTPEKSGEPRPYDDYEQDGLITYRYFKTDPNHHYNVGLRDAMREQAPLIYLKGLVEGVYSAVAPVYVVDDHPGELAVTIDPVADALPEFQGVAERAVNRKYALRLIKQRQHQSAFRARVIKAYRVTCAVCALQGHRELLDAAHIIADRHPDGLPEVSNGMALCKLHHAAYESDIVGIRPDLVVAIRKDVLEEKDGPMLLHGLQGMDGRRILVPGRREWQPKAEYLEARYEIFRKAG